MLILFFPTIVFHFPPVDLLLGNLCRRACLCQQRESKYKLLISFIKRLFFMEKCIGQLFGHSVNCFYLAGKRKLVFCNFSECIMIVLLS